jgi:hypothetical protein
MSDDPMTLSEVWRVRNAAAATLGLAEDQMRRAIRAASQDELVALIETFSPARSNGPEWIRTFEPLVERLWTWRDDATMAALAELFRQRGVPWAAVANALSPEEGGRIRDTLRHPAWSRLPAFTVV